MVSNSKSSFGCILLFGPPGCGKTHFLKSTANQFKLPMELINCKNLKEDFMEGIKTQMFFKKLFSRARESAPSMIILDNIDELTSRKSLRDVKIRKAVYQLLRELERIKTGDRLLVTASTNKPQLIEPLLFKAERFGKLLYIPMPDFESRQRLFGLFLNRYRVGGDINTRILGRITKGFTSYDIKRIVKHSKQLAAQDGIDISMHHLESAVNRIRPSVGSEVLEPIRQFFIRNKRGLLGDEPDQEYDDAEAVDQSELAEDDEPDFEITVDDDSGDSGDGLEIDWGDENVDEEDQDAEEEDEVDSEKENIEENEDSEDKEDDSEVEDWDKDENTNEEDSEDEKNEQDQNGSDDDRGHRRRWIQDDYRP